MRHRKGAAGSYTPAPLADKNIDMGNGISRSSGQNSRKEVLPIEAEGPNMGALPELNAGQLRHGLEDGREYR